MTQPDEPDGSGLPPRPSYVVQLRSPGGKLFAAVSPPDDLTGTGVGKAAARARAEHKAVAEVTMSKS